MSEPAPDTFAKLPAVPPPEDRDGNGLTERPSVRWLLWLTDAATVFCRGVLAGMFPGVGGSIGAVALTDSTQPETLVTNGALGFAAGLLVKGLERLHMWQAKPENEMPNPCRAERVEEHFVPMKDAERVAKIPAP